MAHLSPASPPVAGRYQVTRWIGAGGMQNVYEAHDKLFGRNVALKVPKDDAGVRRFQKSAVVSAKVNHLNVAKTLDYIEDNSGSFLIEELIDGLDISKIFPDLIPIFPPSACARIFHQLAKGLAASHDAGVIHRDLKPSNIMVAGGPILTALKITDFGIAKMAEAEIGEWADPDKGGGGSTSSKTVLGAIPYMAPESISDFKNSSFASDVWAVAAIVYELMSGIKPFGKGPASIVNILKAEPPQRPALLAGAQFRRLGGEIYDLILSCLQKDPIKRPTATSLSSSLEELCYAVEKFEFGTISKVHNSNLGFASADSGSDVMYHVASFYGPSNPALGDRIWFARHPGTGNDRAFPIVKLLKS